MRPGKSVYITGTAYLQALDIGLGGQFIGLLNRTVSSLP